LAAGLRAQGRNLLDALDALARQHGLVTTSQVAFRVTDIDQIAAAAQRFRNRPPRKLLGDPVVESVDHLPAADAMLLRTERARVVVRPSGTEPKLKCYLQVSAPVQADDDVTALRRACEQDLEVLAAEISAVLGL